MTSKVQDSPRRPELTSDAWVPVDTTEHSDISDTINCDLEGLAFESQVEVESHDTEVSYEEV